MLPQAQIEKFGGFATITMNGWPKFLAELMARDVPFVRVNLSVRITVFKQRILSYAGNGGEDRFR